MIGMNHREFVTRLPACVKADLTARSDAAGLWHLAGHIGAILALGTWIGSGLPGWWALTGR